jgi:hypothetical protein
MLWGEPAMKGEPGSKIWGLVPALRRITLGTEAKPGYTMIRGWDRAKQQLKTLFYEKWNPKTQKYDRIPVEGYEEILKPPPTLRR